VSEVRKVRNFFIKSGYGNVETQHLKHKVEVIIVVVQVGSVKIYEAAVGDAQEKGKRGSKPG
jgi:hypothetical protein